MVMCRCRMLRQWSFAVLLLCFPVTLHGGPITGLSNRVKRSVTHAQLMHDKGQALQDLKRRLWLQELLQEVHTAVFQDSLRSGLLGHPMTRRTSQHAKPASVSKIHPLAFHLEGAEAGAGAGAGAHISLPQETEKALRFRGQSMKAAGQRRKRTWFDKWSQKEKKRHQTHSVQMQGSQH